MCFIHLYRSYFIMQFDYSTGILCSTSVMYACECVCVMYAHAQIRFTLELTDSHMQGFLSLPRKRTPVYEATANIERW